MAKFVVGTPVETEEAKVSVDVTPRQPLSVGTHEFQLEAVDDAGNESLPVTVKVTVRDTQRPTAVITAPQSVGYGQKFILDGSKSKDLPPGKIVKYIWIMLS